VGVNTADTANAINVRKRLRLMSGRDRQKVIINRWP